MTIVLVLLLLLFENVPEFFFPNWVVVFRFIFFRSLLSFLIWNLFPFAKRLENQRCYRIRISTNEDAVRLIVNSYCNHKQIQIVALCEFLVLILRSAENVPIIVDSMWCKQSMCCTVHFPPDARKWLWEHHEFSVQCTLHIAQHAYW